MKLFEFMLLEKNEQVDLLYEAGVYLGKRKTGGFCRLLYQYESFYVELTYFHYRVSIRSIRCFTSTGPLDPYLERICLYELISC